MAQGKELFYFSLQRLDTIHWITATIELRVSSGKRETVRYVGKLLTEFLAMVRLN